MELQGLQANQWFASWLRLCCQARSSPEKYSGCTQMLSKIQLRPCTTFTAAWFIAGLWCTASDQSIWLPHKELSGFNWLDSQDPGLFPTTMALFGSGCSGCSVMLRDTCLTCSISPEDEMIAWCYLDPTAEKKSAINSASVFPACSHELGLFGKGTWIQTFVAQVAIRTELFVNGVWGS